ncbi:hypothetical protein C4J81_10275 [Deltaproteobacteria bacterium Smac51]|nr:hypothetical protein C4J81_10275 [Deltaproteobacteria bacterium Smac51]
MDLMSRRAFRHLSDGPFIQVKTSIMGRLGKAIRRLATAPFSRLKSRSDPPFGQAAPQPSGPTGLGVRLKCGHCGQAPRLAEYHGLASCRLANFHDQGPLVCPYGCLGYGDCAAACPHGAIIVCDGFPVVYETLCTGCGNCLKACPKQLLSLVRPGGRAFIACSARSGLKKNAAYCEWACLGCARCRKACPAGAIVREGASGAFTVNQDICRAFGKSCGRACAESCPRDLFDH